MKTPTKPILIAIAVLAALPSPTLAGPGKSKDKGAFQPVEVHLPADCTLPPGIAKQIREGKRDSLPPGIEKNCAEHKGFAKGERLPEGYVIVTDFDKYMLPDPGEDRYAISGDTIYKIARDAAIVIAAVGIYNNITGN